MSAVLSDINFNSNFYSYLNTARAYVLSLQSRPYTGPFRPQASRQFPVSQMERYLAGEKDPRQLIQLFAALTESKKISPTISFASYAADPAQRAQEFQHYLDQHFPQLEFLLSDSCACFIFYYLKLLSPLETLNFYKSLLGYVHKLAQDLDQHVAYPDQILPMYLKITGLIQGFKNHLEHKIQEHKIQKHSDSKPSHISAKKSVNLVTRTVRKTMQAVLKNPGGTISFLLATAGTRGLRGVQATATNASTAARALALQWVTPSNATVGRLWTLDITDLLACNSFDASALQTRLCFATGTPITDVSEFHPDYTSAAHWLSYSVSGNFVLRGSPTSFDRFWQLAQVSFEVRTCNVDPDTGEALQLCPQSEIASLLVPIYIPNSPPTLVSSNSSQARPDPRLKDGVQPLICPDDLSCTGSFVENGKIVDPENDPIGTQVSPGNTLMPAVPNNLRWFGTLGPLEIFLVPPPFARGARWNFTQVFFDANWNNQRVHSDWSDPQRVIPYDNPTQIGSYVLIPHSEIFLTNPLGPSYSLRSFAAFSLSLNNLFTTQTGAYLDLSMHPLPANASFDSRLALFSWTPTPNQRGSYLINIVACNRPSSLCQTYLDFCTPLPPTCINTSTTLQAVNTGPQWLVNPLPGASGLAGDLIQTTVYPQYSQDIDQDPGHFSLSPLTNNLNQTALDLSDLPRLSPQALGQINLQWLIPRNISAGAYSFIINRTDPFGATGTTLWTVTVLSVLIKNQATAYSAATFGLGITAIVLVFLAAIAGVCIYKKRKRAATSAAAITTRVTRDLAQADTVVNLDTSTGAGAEAGAGAGAGSGAGAGAGAGAGSMPQISPSSTLPVHVCPPSSSQNTLPTRRLDPRRTLPPLLPAQFPRTPDRHREALKAEDLAADILAGPRVSTRDASHAAQAEDLPGPSTVFGPRVSITRRHSESGLRCPIEPH